jgi:hypothetical protein
MCGNDTHVMKPHYYGRIGGRRRYTSLVSVSNIYVQHPAQDRRTPKVVHASQLLPNFAMRPLKHAHAHMSRMPSLRRLVMATPRALPRPTYLRAHWHRPRPHPRRSTRTNVRPAPEFDRLRARAKLI